VAASTPDFTALACTKAHQKPNRTRQQNRPREIVYGASSPSRQQRKIKRFLLQGNGRPLVQTGKCHGGLTQPLTQ